MKNAFCRYYGTYYQDPKNGKVYKEKKSDTTRLFKSTVFVRRWGEAIFPVEVKISFTNGEIIEEQWDGKERWIRFEYLKEAKVEKVEVDPEHKLILDFNYANNSWLKESQAGIASFKWATKWMIWMQNLMEFFSFFS